MLCVWRPIINAIVATNSIPRVHKRRLNETKQVILLLREVRLEINTILPVWSTCYEQAENLMLVAKSGL